jgi:PPOX class probable F420-dependent enzyme
MTASTGSGHGFDLEALPGDVLDFLAERHLASLTTLRRDGTPHVVPVGFTYDAATKIARVITSGDSVKARNAERPDAVAAICQVDGARWLTVSGPVRVDRDPAVVADAVARYARRYKQPRVNPKRVALIIELNRMMGSSRFG